MNGKLLFPALALVSTLALVACGSSVFDGTGGGAGGGVGGGSAGSGGGSGGNATCSVTLSGATSGTFSCLSFASYDPGSNQTSFVVEVLDTGDTFTAAITLGNGDSFAAGTFTQANTLSAMSTASGLWDMSAHNPGMVDQGSISLLIASAGPPCTDPSGAVTWYQVQGSMQVELEPESASTASGTVTASATFTGDMLGTSCDSDPGGGSGGGSAGGGSGGGSSSAAGGSGGGAGGSSGDAGGSSSAAGGSGGGAGGSSGDAGGAGGSDGGGSDSPILTFSGGVTATLTGFTVIATSQPTALGGNFTSISLEGSQPDQDRDPLL